jgi:hypothetical protein
MPECRTLSPALSAGAVVHLHSDHPLGSTFQHDGTPIAELAANVLYGRSQATARDEW